MSITEIVTLTNLARDAILAVAAAVTATVAIKGLSSWNRELTGKAAFEAARALARATYKLRDEIKNCRAPFLAENEFPEDYRGQTVQITPHGEAQALAHAYKNRFHSVRSALQEFDSHTLEAEAIWGKEIRMKTDVLRHCVSELRSAIDAVIEDKASGGKNFADDQKFGKEMRGKVSTARGSENALSRTINEALQGIENVIRPHLKRV